MLFSVAVNRQRIGAAIEVETIMTKNEFAVICGQYLIDIGIALENENVIAAVKAGDILALHHVLQTEF